MDKKSKIFVAGHGGMVGSAVVRFFTQKGYSNLLLKTRRELDLFNQKKVSKFFCDEKPDMVILCAARVGGIKANMKFPADFLYENLEIQNNVIWSAHNSKVKKLLFLGSSCIYPRDCPQPMKEECLLQGPLEPTNEGYAIAKIAGMKLCEKIYEQFGQIFISCMPANIYGINDNFDPESSHVIPALIRKMHEAKKENKGEVVIWGSGNSKRDFLFVDDLADAIFWLMQNYKEKSFLNIGTGEEVSIKELAFIIKEVVGFEGNLIFDTTKPDGMPRKLLDVTKTSALGWSKKTGLKEGLLSTYAFFQKNCL